MANEFCSDEELVARFSRGCTYSFDVFVRRHEEWVYSLAYHLTTSSADAETVLGGVFLKFWKSASDEQSRTFIERSPLESILRAVVAESAQVLASASESLRDPQTVLPEKIVLENLEAIQGYTKLEKALGRLPFEYRRVFVLHDVNSLGIALVARILDSSEDECRNQLRRARMMIRRVLKRDETDTQVSDGFQARDDVALGEIPKTIL